MSYTKDGKQYEARQLTADEIVNCGGDLQVPAGYWVVKDSNGEIVECPSDAGLKANYSEVKSSQPKPIQQATEL
jgi:hypothetical protein